MDNLLYKIHGYNIYENFEHQKYIPKLIGWNINPELFKHLITTLKPKLIIELGSWYGASAICMGNIIKDLQLSTKIVCVDTWLGSYEFIGLHEADYDRQLFPTFGYPNAYYQFLANVCYHDMQDIIIPFPQTIRLACKWLSVNKFEAELIYIDGNNDIFDVYNDMNEAWKILGMPGAMFGDDYNNPDWPTVNLGVNKFCIDNALKPMVLPEFQHHWILNKHNVN